MIQRNWRRVAFAAPIMLAMFLGSGGARAQAADLEAAEKSVDPAMVEELVRIVADQQRQLDNQQRQLELQASALNNLQQQIQSVQQSAQSARSAYSQQQAVFREVRRQRRRGQEDVIISGTPPNRLGRIVTHRAGKGGRSGL